MENINNNSTIIANLQTNSDIFLQAVKHEKKQQGKTNQDIADATGIPLSNIGKYLSGNLANQNIYYAAAIAIYLNISIDEVFGIKKENEESSRVEELESKLHDLEKDLFYIKADRDNLKSVLKSRKLMITALFGICMLLIATFCFAVLYDSTVPDNGFIKGGNIAPISFICITVIIIAIATVISILNKEKR